MILTLSLGFGLGVLATVFAYASKSRRNRALLAQYRSEFHRFRVVVDYPHQDTTLS